MLQRTYQEKTVRRETPERSIHNEYLNSQFLAYIGNKRALLPFLKNVFQELDSRNRINTFLDPFAGTGAVSRLGKSLGFEVHANDWELYSYIVNSCYLLTDATSVETFFTDFGGLTQLLNHLNNLEYKAEPYIARYYAPKSLEHADYNRERLFYTPANAHFIDNVRTEIENMYPGEPQTPVRRQEKNILLALLLYQAAKHANTSGVFKAYHKGYGGHGGDALKRILGDMILPRPALIDGCGRYSVSREDAGSFVTRYSADLCYLDPPYNIHQYGSNYFMLNTIAKWDKPAVSLELDKEGMLRQKAGIRQDWTETWSPWCSKRFADQAFCNLLENIDTRYVVLSYNTEGIIPFDLLVERMAAQGKVEIFTQEYVTYRGGKQSNSRSANNIEFVLVLDKSSTHRKRDGLAIEKLILEKKIRTQLKQHFHPRRINQEFHVQDDIFYLDADMSIPVSTRHLFEVTGVPEKLHCSKLAELDLIYRKLQYCLCRGKDEELQILYELLQENWTEMNSSWVEKKSLHILKKIAFKKYRKVFNDTLRKMENLVASAGEKRFFHLRKNLPALEIIANKRISG